MMTPRKKMAADIVVGISEMIVMSHTVVQECDELKREVLKEIMADMGLKLTHKIFEAIK
jgi:hypothetical protein